MRKTLKKITAQGLEMLALACAGAAALGMVTIVGVIVTSVLMRKFANSPLHITEEVVGLLLSVSLFLGLPMVTLRAKHVRIALVANMFKGKWHVAVQIVALMIGVGFFTWLIVESIPWFEFAFKRNLKTETTRILLYPWMALMPLSLSLTCAILFARLFGFIDRIDDNDTEIESGQNEQGEANS
ncbi:TRAP transporter small permease [Parasedimentitalea psychrophila]|uniref:TRAP transporter small permease protein n=1 Tax=Parasedimentitalea psychrophila TaxID=2997337 RepID=A0A9Y2L0B6_9RHOB|nr:TRAP transporter small permease [Parasedimentitalea psychrophila]WIY24499.1 TRAP transporter small permease [Parasedimentitalea psychrophila]